MLGWKELLFIGIIVVVLFGGATQLPKIMKSLGQGLKEFKKAAKDVKDNIEEEVLSDDQSEKPSEDKKD